MFHLKAMKASGVVDLVSISDKSGEQLAEVKNATELAMLAATTTNYLRGQRLKL